MKRDLLVLTIVTGFFLLSAPASCQEITASITGTITDPSGAVVPNATVVVHNDDTKTDVRTVQTGGTGSYTVPLLPVGNYTVTIKAPGFEDYIAKGVILHVGDHYALNAQLKTAVVSQEVTVTTSAAPVQIASAAQSTTITGTQITELELDNRNFEQLLTLVPGVASSLPAVVGFGIENTDYISVNGARGSANNWTVDGSDVNDTGSNLTLLNVPSVDSLAEFKLERGTYDAQYGRSGGGQVNVVTKSGTSQFHGDAYEFVRNDVFNANDFFNNSVGGTTPPFRYNDFGYTLGGPFYIPGHYNTDKSKTFFFWSEEWRRTRTPGTDILNLPLPQEVQGNFSGISYNGAPVALNPASAPAGCITNNIISPSCFSHNATVYLQNVYSKFTPQVVTPTSSGLLPYLGQYIIPENALSNYRQEILRVDQKITDKIQVFGRYMQDSVPTTEPGGLFAGAGLPGISAIATNAPGRNVVAHVTMSLSPTLVNEAAFNYSWGAINSNITGLIDNSSFLSALNESSFPYHDPYGRVPGISFPGGDAQGIGIPVSPYFERNIDKQVYDNLSIVRGNHTIRTGATLQYLRKSENAVNPTNGSFTFGTTYGNPAFANFLLGDSDFFSQASRDIIPDLYMPDVEAYVQDDWKIRPNFTLNLGLRWAFLPTPTDQNLVLDNFDPALYNPADAPALDPTTGNFLPGQPFNPGNYGNGIIVARNACLPSHYFEPLPAAGGATCSPYGNRIAPDYNTWAPRFGFAWDPFKTGKTSIRGGYGIYYDRTLNGIFEQNSFADPPFVGNAFSAPGTPLDNFDNPTQGAFIPLGPVGIHSTGTPNFRVPYNQQWSISVQREIMRNTLFEVAYVGSKGTDLLGIYDFNQVPLATRLASPNTNVETLRPYLGYDTMSAIGTEFNSNYNSLQISLNRRMSHGLSLGVAYTWAKTLTNNPSDRSDAPYDTYNFAADYGPASFSVGQDLIVNYVYDLPFYQSQRGLLGHVLGGWEVSGITTFQQGFPTSIYQCCDPFNSYDYAPNTPGTFPGGIGIDPSVVAPRPDRVSMAPGPGTVAEYINTSDYSFAVGHFGNSGRGVAIGPGLNNWDIAAIKNIKITERVNTQFRAEFFNAFNHVSFNSFNNFLTSPAFGQLNGDYTPRLIQLGLKLYF
jgi:hypothetical protein